MTTRIILSGLLLIAVLVMLAWQLHDVIDERWIDTWVRGQGLRGQLLFIAVAALLASVGLSRQVLAFLGGYSFGFVQGMAFSMIAVVAGCVTTFQVSRHFLQARVRRRFSERVDRIDRFLGKNTFTATLMFRLLPAGSNFLVNVAAGASGVRGTPFFLGSTLGYLPQMLVFSLVGSGARVTETWQVVIAMALFVVAAVMGVVLYRRYHSDGVA